jgi:hypothetical protein
VCGPEYDKGIDLFVLLFDRREDQRSQIAAERPAGMRNNTSHYRFRQRLAYIYRFEALVNCAEAGIVLAGIKLTCNNRFSHLHFSALLKLFFDCRLPIADLQSKIVNRKSQMIILTF